MPSPLNIQPIGDWRHTFTVNPVTGEIVVDLALAPNGDLNVVTGIDRLVQMVIFWLLTPQGHVPWDPRYGNPFYWQLGRPVNGDVQQTFLDMLDACEHAFLTNQDQAAQAGHLSSDEMVDSFIDNQVNVIAPGQVVVSFTIVARSGASKSLNVPFATNLAAGQGIIHP